MAGREGVRRTSTLALLALMCAVVVFCPVATLAGVALGIAALREMRGRPDVAGRPYAILAIVIGALFTPAFLVAIVVGGRHQQAEARRLEAEIETLVDDALGEARRRGAAGLVARIGDGTGPDAVAAADAFLGALDARYGRFRDARLDPDAPRRTGGERPGPRVPYAMLLEFDGATVPASVVVETTAPADGGPTLRLRSITMDPGAGDPLRFPPDPDPEPAPAAAPR